MRDISMLPVSYPAPAETTAPLFAAAFAEGCGGEVSTVYQPTRPWAGFGSPKTWDHLRETRKRGGEWYYGDHAYFGRRVYFRATRNAYQHPGHGETDGRRFARMGIEIKPWQRGGSEILVCPPDAGWARLMNMDPNLWLAEVKKKLHANSDRTITVRRRGSRVPLVEQFRPGRTWAVVTYTSNIAVDALLYGVPAFVTGDCAARSMARSDPVNIEFPFRPDDRERWLGVLADNQWTLPEIAAGLAWEKLK
jgi:hypothetical protein